MIRRTPKKPPQPATASVLPATHKQIVKGRVFQCEACGHLLFGRKEIAPNRKCSECQSTKLRELQAVMFA